MSGTTQISILGKLQPPRVSALPTRTFAVLYVDTESRESLLSIHFEGDTIEESLRMLGQFGARIVGAADDALRGIQTAARNLATASLYPTEDLCDADD